MREGLDEPGDGGRMVDPCGDDTRERVHWKEMVGVEHVEVGDSREEIRGELKERWAGEMGQG